MTQELEVKDFFNPDGTLQENEDVKFENLIKYLDYLRTGKNGYKYAYCDILEFFRERGGCFENYTTQIIKEGLFEGTICLKFRNKEYIYTLPIELVWLLDDNIGGRIEKVEDQIVESFGMQFEYCSLVELMDSLGKNRDTSKYIGYYYSKYAVEIGIFPFLLANHNFDVVKWALDNLGGFYIETDKVEDWEEEDSDEDEEDRIFERYDLNIPDFADEDLNMLKALVYFLVNENQSPEIIEYILSHIKNGQEILEDPKIKNLILELKSDTPNWNTIYGTLDYCQTKGIVKVNDYQKKVYLIPFGALHAVSLEVSKKNIEKLKNYLNVNKEDKNA